MTWYVAITNPNCQRRAEAGLAAIGYRSFWPRQRKWVSRARTKRAKEFPILKRYLFVDVHDGNFFAARNVNGVEGFVSFADESGLPRPAAVPESAVQRFMVRYHTGEWDEIAKDRIPHGAIVQILKGEYAKQEVVITGRRRGKLKFLPHGKRDFAFIREENVWVA